MKASKKDKRRLLLLILIFIPLLVLFISKMFTYWTSIYKNIREKEELEIAYEEILKEEKKLKSEIVKLQDPDYIARYAREKYLYSKDGEIIIKIN